MCTPVPFFHPRSDDTLRVLNVAAKCAPYVGVAIPATAIPSSTLVGAAAEKFDVRAGILAQTREYSSPPGRKKWIRAAA